ncbi:MAG: BamA/TamA family outer membrane protein [Prevotellaceae bacterium]|nr:BamA/TamA family outer membrane protein [Prevotellaceae bacterium]
MCGKRTYIIYAATLFLLNMILLSCSVDRYIPDDQHMLTKTTVVCDNKNVAKNYSLSDYIVQNTNTKWFGARVPLKIYTLSGTDTTKRFCRVMRRLGEAPVLYDTLKSARTISDIRQVLSNAGYMKATVDEKRRVKGKKVAVTYDVHPNKRYTIRSIQRSSDDSNLRQFICVEDTSRSLLKVGRAFDVNVLNNERNRIASFLRNHGYYKFTKENVRFSADTARNSTEVDVSLRITLHQENGRSEATEHKQYVIGNVNFYADVASKDEPIDSVNYRGYKFFYQDDLHFRKNMLASKTMFYPGELYDDNNFRRTYANYTRLSAISYSNIQLAERQGSDTLDCNISVNHAKPHSFGFDVEATNSAGDLGAAISTSYQNKNIFRGSETFIFKVRGAYEAITGLEGYEGNNYTEFGAESRLNFPMFLLPYVKRDWGALHNAVSEIALQYNFQNRPEFQRRVLTAAWRYRWNSRNQHIQHRFDLLEVNYVYMPWISQTFKEQYLDSLGKTNAILKYNYENLLITKLGYTYSYNSLGAKEQTYGKDAYTFRFNIETSGNVLNAFSKMTNASKNEDGQYKFCGIAFAQYVRGDIDFSKSFRIDKNNSVAFHAALGVAYPYGNSNQLPFEKRYFAGGANSVRGWSVRSLGPGAYNGADKGINFLNQSGDIKLDLNLEYRALLFWKLSGAAFIDAGNIWTIRKYEDQPNGEFRFNKFIEQIAASYGIGIRMDASFFIIRFDAGMKAVNPAFKGKKHYPILHPNFNRDFAFHFAVGMPF